MSLFKKREKYGQVLATQMDGLRCETVEAGAAAQPRFPARASSLSDMLSLCGARWCHHGRRLAETRSDQVQRE